MQEPLLACMHDVYSMHGVYSMHDVSSVCPLYCPEEKARPRGSSAISLTTLMAKTADRR